MADDLWHFTRRDGFVLEELSVSDGGTSDAGDPLLEVFVDDGDRGITIALPWAAVRELTHEVLDDWLTARG